MTVRDLAWAVGVFGVLTTLLLLVGANSIGGIFAFFQLGLFVGAPLALMLQSELRSVAVSVVVAAVLSIALSAIAVQLLIWFRVASAELLVISATAYGLALALLLSSEDLGQSSRSEIGRR